MGAKRMGQPGQPPLEERAAGFVADLARGEYGEERVVLLAGSLPDDGLVVMAPSDGPEIFEVAESLAEAAGVSAGWDRSTPAGRHFRGGRRAPETGPSALPTIAIWRGHTESVKMFRLLRRVARARHTLTSESRLLDRNSRLRAPHRIKNS